MRKSKFTTSSRRCWLPETAGATGWPTQTGVMPTMLAGLSWVSMGNIQVGVSEATRTPRLTIHIDPCPSKPPRCRVAVATRHIRRLNTS